MDRIILLSNSTHSITKYIVSDEYIRRCNDLNKVTPLSISEYLESGAKVRLTLMSSESIFDDQLVPVCSNVQSDGKWAWSSDLIHYTKHHYFQWPEGFYKHVKGMNYMAPKISSDQSAQIHDLFHYALHFSEDKKKIEIEEIFL